MRFFFLVDTTLKARRDDHGRVLSVHANVDEAQSERSRPEYREILEDLKVIEADYKQLDRNRFLMAQIKNLSN